MLKLSASLVFFFLTRLSAAQFAAYPVCVQPLLDRAFPAICLSLTLAAQNTCLCQNANAFGSALVTGINQQCGCADLEETVQLAEAYCTQVGIDIGPAFSVFIQDNSGCGGNTGSGASTGSGGGTSTGTGGSTSTGTGSGTSTGTGGSTSTGTAGGTSTGIGGSTSTGTTGGTSTGTGGDKSTGAGGTKNSGVKNKFIIERIVKIVIGVTGWILAL